MKEKMPEGQREVLYALFNKAFTQHAKELTTLRYGILLSRHRLPEEKQKQLEKDYMHIHNAIAKFYKDAEFSVVSMARLKESYQRKQTR